MKRQGKQETERLLSAFREEADSQPLLKIRQDKNKKITLWPFVLWRVPILNKFQPSGLSSSELLEKITTHSFKKPQQPERKGSGWNTEYMPSDIGAKEKLNCF